VTVREAWPFYERDYSKKGKFLELGCSGNAFERLFDDEQWVRDKVRRDDVSDEIESPPTGLCSKIFDPS
jgi:hypothetical protein